MVGFTHCLKWQRGVTSLSLKPKESQMLGYSNHMLRRSFLRPRKFPVCRNAGCWESPYSWRSNDPPVGDWTQPFPASRPSPTPESLLLNLLKPTFPKGSFPASSPAWLTTSPPFAITSPPSPPPGDQIKNWNFHICLYKELLQNWRDRKTNK